MNKLSVRKIEQKYVWHLNREKDCKKEVLKKEIDSNCLIKRKDTKDNLRKIIIS